MNKTTTSPIFQKFIVLSGADCEGAQLDTEIVGIYDDADEAADARQEFRETSQEGTMKYHLVDFADLVKYYPTIVDEKWMLIPKESVSVHYRLAHADQRSSYSPDGYKNYYERLADNSIPSSEKYGFDQAMDHGMDMRRHIWDGKLSCADANLNVETVTTYVTETPVPQIPHEGNMVFYRTEMQAGRQVQTYLDKNGNETKDIGLAVRFDTRGSVKLMNDFSRKVDRWSQFRAIEI